MLHNGRLGHYGLATDLPNVPLDTEGEAVMAEQVAIGNATLFLADSRELLPTLQGIDAVVTDPPYGIGKASWDSEYPEWLESTAFAAAKCVIVMPGMWALPKCVAGMGDRYRGIIAGRNLNGMTTGPLGMSNWIPAVCGGEVPRRGQDCFEFVVMPNDKPRHPTPKPSEYMRRLIDRTTEPGWLVCDPFMGSGTTGVACLEQGRRFIGIEREPEHFEEAVERISLAHSQLRLFA